MCVHVDLVGSISPYHVQDGEAAARVPIDDIAKMQDMALVYHDWLAFRDLLFYHLRRKSSISRHLWF
jgi:hypothetical protein